jgi:hypothetical protein
MKKINGVKVNKAKFVIEFDNGGGALFVTRSYIHHYDDGADLADDVWLFMQNSDTSGWDNNHKEDGFKLSHHQSCIQIDRSGVEGFDIAALEDMSGHTERNFFKRIAEHFGLDGLDEIE